MHWNFLGNSPDFPFVDWNFGASTREDYDCLVELVQDEGYDIYVADYATKACTDAKKAFFVLGSQARGPMNEPNLPAFATREAADAHAKAQGGKVLAFGEITREVVKSLAGGHNH